MRGVRERGFAIPFCLLLAVSAIETRGTEPLPAAKSLTGGLEKLQLSSYYDAQPTSITANAASYSLPIRVSEIVNAEHICLYLGLDDNAKEAIERNGFVVVNATDPLGEMYDDMVDPYVLSTENGIPNFVTSDSLLHLYHVQFDEILRCVEENEFFPTLVSMTGVLLDEALSQYESFSGELKEAARRNVAYFTVATKLLSENATVPEFVSDEVDSELSRIDAHAGFGPSAIFIYEEDYSQYVPRGHYTRSDTLKKYFRAMMWYGRMSFLLKGHEDWGPSGEALISVEDARIQTMEASLITLALDSLQAEGTSIAGIWNRIYAVTAFFVGLADDLTPYEYKESILKVFGSPVDVEDFNDEEKMFELKVELALLRSPEIYGGTGNCAVTGPITREGLDEILEKTKGMRFMGQRFIPDSYMFQNLVFPVVGNYTGSGKPFTMEFTGAGRPARCFPRGLDVMAVLGSDEAMTILEREGDTDYVNYDTAFNDLAEQFEAFTEQDWNKNLYWSWLYTLKSLLGGYGQGYPAFMQGSAWRDKELNTALASWAELRHDTILYAKQSYTPWESTPPRPDRGYVEPVPEFYNRLLALTRMTRTGLSDMSVLDSTQESRLVGLEQVLARLLDISIAEVEGGELGEDDYSYIENFGAILTPLIEGLSDEKGAATTLIADVHTDTNTEQVLEEGAGYVRLIVVAYPIPESGIVLGTGPVFSYYEFKWRMDDRLTDEKWTEMLEKGENAAEPDWVRSFVHPVSLPLQNDDDADADQLSDTWEESVWGNIAAVNDPKGDYDGDGHTNEEEYLAETNPRERNSFLRVLSLQSSESETLLRWASVAGRRYRVSYSDDLRSWHLLGTPVTADGEMASFADPSEITHGRRFYRVNVIPF